MKIIKKISIISIISIVFCLCSIASLYAITDYTLDISPDIKSSKMFSVGYALSYSEYNGIFSDGTLYYGDIDSINLTFVSSTLAMTPYFEYRPLQFLEIGLSIPFSYTETENYDSLLNTSTISKNWSFDSIHSHIKVSAIDWLISLGFRMDFNYNFSGTFGRQGNFDIYGKIFVGIIPKIIPVNLLINYEQGIDAYNIQFGQLQGAIEVITSNIITLAVGLNYMIPYTAENNISKLEAFAKLTLFFDDYFSGNVSYGKIFYGENIGNNSTFLINLSYHF